MYYLLPPSLPACLPASVPLSLPPPPPSLILLFSDWNTSFDEDTIPQLRQVSCAALACLLKHTGLFHYACNTSRSDKTHT